MLNKYYQKYKERIWKEARERYQNFSEEEKDKRREKGSRKISKFFWIRIRIKTSKLFGT